MLHKLYDYFICRFSALVLLKEGNFWIGNFLAV